MSYLHVRVPEEDLERWQQAARLAGMNMSQYVRRTMNDRVSLRDPGNFAQRVADGVVDEILPVLRERLGPQVVFPAQEPRPQAFAPQCENFDIHQIGATCEICGGNGLARARPA